MLRARAGLALVCLALACGSSASVAPVDASLSPDLGTATIDVAADFTADARVVGVVADGGTNATDTSPAGPDATVDVTPFRWPDTGVAVTDGAPATTDTSSALCPGYDGYTPGELRAATDPMGRCANPTDLDLSCQMNVREVAAACGVACIGMGSGCITICIQNRFLLSAGCTDCYTSAVLCAQMNCLAPCLTDSKSDACTQCQSDHGCLSGFFSCSGLPPPPQKKDAGAP